MHARQDAEHALPWCRSHSAPHRDHIPGQFYYANHMHACVCMCSTWTRHAVHARDALHLSSWALPADHGSRSSMHASPVVQLPYLSPLVGRSQLPSIRPNQDAGRIWMRLRDAYEVRQQTPCINWPSCNHAVSTMQVGASVLRCGCVRLGPAAAGQPVRLPEALSESFAADAKYWQSESAATHTQAKCVRCFPKREKQLG